MIPATFSAMILLSLGIICLNPARDEFAQGPTASRQDSAGTEQNQKDLDFKETMVGEAVTSDGLRYPWHNWQSSDGVGVSSSSLRYNSVDQSREAFVKRLGQASKIIERGPRTDKSGHITGERAVATFSYPEKKEVYGEVLWADGRELHEVGSSSLLHALAFEDKFYPISKPNVPPSSASP